MLITSPKTVMPLPSAIGLKRQLPALILIHFSDLLETNSVYKHYVINIGAFNKSSIT